MELTIKETADMIADNIEARINVLRDRKETANTKFQIVNASWALSDMNRVQRDIEESGKSEYLIEHTDDKLGTLFMGLYYTLLEVEEYGIAINVRTAKEQYAEALPLK